MRTSLIFGLAASLLLPAGASSAFQTPGTAAASADEQMIRRLQQEWMDAWVRQDLVAIEQILAPDYTLTVSSMPGRPITREEWIGMLPRYTADAFEYRDMRVLLFGDVAVVSSVGRGVGAQVNGADRSFPFFLTDVWERRNGRWQVVARYSSIPEQNTTSSERLLQPR